MCVCSIAKAFQPSQRFRTLTNPKKEKKKKNKARIKPKLARTLGSTEGRQRCLWPLLQVRRRRHVHWLSSFNPPLLQFQFCKLSLYFDLLTRHDLQRRRWLYWHLLPFVVAFLARFIEAEKERQWERMGELCEGRKLAIQHGGAVYSYCVFRGETWIYFCFWFLRKYLSYIFS